jgi:hypothetical protein
MPAYRIEEWTPADSPEAANRARYALDVARGNEEWPEDPIEPFDVWLRDRIEHPSYQRPMWWHAYGDDDALLGAAHLNLEYVEDNRHLAWFDLYVTPGARRRRRRVLDVARRREEVDRAQEPPHDRQCRPADVGGLGFART